MCNTRRSPGRRRAQLLLAALATAGIALTGCKSKKQDSGKTDPATAKAVDWRVQGRVPTQMRMVKPEPTLIAEGKGLYATCSGCHGMDGGGVIGVGPKLNSATFQAAASDDMLIRTIEKGRKGTTMVPFGATYKREQVFAIVAYIRSLKPTKPAALDEKTLAGDAASGGKLFRDVCSGCHGRNGAGYQETANGTGIGRWAFLSNASNGYIRYMVKHGKSGTAMKGFDKRDPTAVANLNNQQIDDIITYLRKNAW